MSRISLITTVLNEADSIVSLLESVAEQTLRPDEVVVVDGGSTDATASVVESFPRQPFPIRLLVAPGSSRSQGRNLAFEAAEGDIVAVTDGGSRLDPHWMERITRPLLEDPTVEVASGYYANAPSSRFEECVGAFTRWNPSELDERTFLPSSRSLALRKRVWRAAGGYPEQFRWNEDTVFDLRLKRAGLHFALVREALVFHRPSSTLAGLFRQHIRYARGDGQAGIRPLTYLVRFVAPYLAGLGLVFLGFLAWPFWGLLAALVVAYLFRSCLQAYRRWRSGWVFLWGLPIVFTLDLAKVVGWLWGTLERLGRPEFRSW